MPKERPLEAIGFLSALFLENFVVATADDRKELVEEVARAIVDQQRLQRYKNPEGKDVSIVYNIIRKYFPLTDFSAHVNVAKNTGHNWADAQLTSPHPEKAREVFEKGAEALGDAIEKAKRILARNYDHEILDEINARARLLRPRAWANPDL